MPTILHLIETTGPGGAETVFLNLFVVSEREAVLVSAGDAAGLGRALADVLENRESARLRCDRASERLDREFAVGPWVQRYRDIYSSLL